MVKSGTSNCNLSTCRLCRQRGGRQSTSLNCCESKTQGSSRGWPSVPSRRRNLESLWRGKVSYSQSNEPQPDSFGLWCDRNGFPDPCKTVSLDQFDEALDSGDVKSCWSLIQRWKASFDEMGSGVNYRGSSEGDAHESASGDDLRHRFQLVTNVPGPGPSSQKASGGYDWSIDLVAGGTVESSIDENCEDVHSGSGHRKHQHLSMPCIDWVPAFQQQFWVQTLAGRHKKFVQICLRSGHKDFALEYLRLFPNHPRMFSLLLREFLQVGDPVGVLEVLSVRGEMGWTPDQYSYSAHISALGRLGRTSEARELFNRAISEGIRSIYVYNSMLDAYGRQGDVHGAKEVWDQIEVDGMWPDAVSYTGMIRALGGAGQMNEIKGLIEQMVACKLRPMPHTFTVLFDAAAACKEQDSVWLLSMCDLVFSQGIVMNQHILSALITALSQSKMSAAQIDRVFGVVEDFRSQVECPGKQVYSSLLSFCGRQHIPERAVDVWDAMVEDRVTPNGWVFSAALSTCCSGNPSHLLTGFSHKIVEQLRDEWSRNNRCPERNNGMLAAFNSLLNVCGWQGHVTRALDVYNSMRENGPKPDIITYNTLLAVLGSNGDVATAMEVLGDMENDGVEATTTTYSSLLNACAKSGNVEMAQSLFDQMIELGVEATVECYTSLMDACVKSGSEESLEYAFEKFEEMKAEGCAPTPVTYGCLLGACEKRSDIDRGFELYQEAYDRGVVPQDKCHNILVNMCTRAGRLDEALELIKVLAKKHGAIEHQTLNSLVRALSEDFVERALVMLRLMRNRDMHPTRETYHALIVGCSKDGQATTAYELYAEMRGKGIKGCRSVGSELVTALCIAGELQQACRVIDDMTKSAGLPGFKKWVGECGGGEMDKIVRDKMIHNHAQLPDASSLGALTCLLVHAGKLTAGMKVFRRMKLQEGGRGLCLLVTEMQQVFETLIERGCQQGKVDWALEVFDDWKEAAATVMAENRMESGEEMAYKRYPRLSHVPLAYLESHCKSDRALEWRVYDVCATMRQQQEWAHEAELPRPPQPSFHFGEIEES